MRRIVAVHQRNMRRSHQTELTQSRRVDRSETPSLGGAKCDVAVLTVDLDNRR